MSELKIEIPTSAGSMQELRPALDDAFQSQFPGGMMQRQWNGDVLELTGPGAKGTIVFDGGRLVGTAQLKPPASMMRSMIEEKVSAALKAAVAS